jgi:N6-L-threonylcarbamoyladenine synthase
MAVVLGIDTSNYTSSLSVVAGNTILSDRRRLLTVKSGMRGLKQSEAVFQHMKNLPLLIKMVKEDIKNLQIDAIGVSTKPRPYTYSYMPVFKAGESFADFLSSVIGKPVVKLSHQEGHIEAGLYSANINPNKTFIALHLSGGTNEILKAKFKNPGFDLEILGKSTDLSAGQFIDRIGVIMGFQFPCGGKLDKLAIAGNYRNCIIPSSSKEGFISFSGPETAAEKLVEKNNVRHEDIAAAVFENISRSIIKSLKFLLEKKDIFSDNEKQYVDVLFVGGVSSSDYIRERITEEFKHSKIRVHFCAPRYSTDNSVGTALLCSRYIENIG